MITNTEGMSREAMMVSNLGSEGMKWRSRRGTLQW